MGSGHGVPKPDKALHSGRQVSRPMMVDPDVEDDDDDVDEVPKRRSLSDRLARVGEFIGWSI